MEISTKTSNSQLIQQLEKMELKLKDNKKQNDSEQRVAPHKDPMIVEQQYSKTFSKRKNIKNGKNVKNQDITPKMHNKMLLLLKKWTYIQKLLAVLEKAEINKSEVMK